MPTEYWQNVLNESRTKKVKERDNQLKKLAKFQPKTAWVKSKAERQQWWASLSNQEKGDYLAKSQVRQAIKRRNKSVLVIKRYSNKFSCSTCFHRFGGSCTDNLPNGCPHWFSPDSTFQGIAYK